MNRSFAIALVVLTVALIATIAFLPHWGHLHTLLAPDPLVRPDRFDLAHDEGSREPIHPLQESFPSDSHKIALGEMLFHDRRLSRDESMSCATCHPLDRGGVDGLPRSIRVGGEHTLMNTPTIFNVSENFRLFWNGRMEKLEEQIRNPRDTDTNWDLVRTRLKNDPRYEKAFQLAYGNGVTVEGMQEAIVAFERSLVTVNSRFDRYLRGDTGVLSAQEKEGYRLFKAYGCVSCHQGRAVGGNLYQKLGVFKEYFDEKAARGPANIGREKITGKIIDRHVFRVPSLRNVEVTAPYLHDGSIETLEETVEIMATYQLGRELSQHEVYAIVAFLKSLTGEYRGKPLSGEQP